jgi:hypothetical protein
MVLILRLFKLPHQRFEEHFSLALILFHRKDQLNNLETIDQVDAKDLLYRYIILRFIDKIEDGLVIPNFQVLVYAHLSEGLLSA